MDYSVTMRSAYDRINVGDIEGFGALLADDFVEHEETPGFPPTKEGVLEFFRMYRAAFPDLHMDAEDVLASGDKTVAAAPEAFEIVIGRRVVYGASTHIREVTCVRIVDSVYLLPARRISVKTCIKVNVPSAA